MAPNKSVPRERLADLQKIYDYLCEWLNFDKETKHLVQPFLDSDFITPFFKEYRRDYLEVTAEIEDVDCNGLSRWCVSNNAFALPKYANSATPNKDGWTPFDHAARFLVRVLRFSWDNDGEWTHGQFDPDHDRDFESDTEFFQVWAILQYLQAEWEAANLEEWDVARLGETFASLSLGRL
ncbi:hypothetical protein GGR54DRAFT_444100 [Hypoxylon sp. NC1633]|nr:hypothetical protein GGR54DRAFT_444100 [Hypoxylon sp. NC1633]